MLFLRSLFVLKGIIFQHLPELHKSIVYGILCLEFHTANKKHKLMP